jgi:hypothetical protein
MLPTTFRANAAWSELQRAAVAQVIKSRGAKGGAALNHGVARFVALLRDVQAFDLSRLAPGPPGPHR